MNRWSGLVVVLGILVSACAGPGPVRPEIEATTPVSNAVDLIGEVRLAGIGDGESIEVRPLADPLVDDLVEAAIEQERQQDWAAADASLKQALELSPDDPTLLQWRAEMALAMGQLDAAVQLANTSWELGPRLGSLCRRNWATIGLARALSDLPEAAETARRQGDKCTPTPPVRM